MEWEQIADHDSLTEGPAWDGSGLLYNECAASTTYRFDPATGRSEVWRERTNAANGLMFDREGRLFACEGAGRRVVRYDGNETIVIADRVDGKCFNEPNDLAVDSHGRIWFSDPNYGGRPMELDHESVYRADPQSDGSYSVTRVAFDTERPNGVLLSRDGGELYVADSPHAPGNYYGETSRDAPRQLYSYGIMADGDLDDFNVLHDFGPGRGIDGMCLDSDGRIIATRRALRRWPGADDLRVRTKGPRDVHTSGSGGQADQLFIRRCEPGRALRDLWRRGGISSGKHGSSRPAPGLNRSVGAL